jgi:hypothetical protein
VKVQGRLGRPGHPPQRTTEGPSRRNRDGTGSERSETDPGRTSKEGGSEVMRVMLVGILLMMAGSGAGCSLAPKSFRDMIHPAPIVRARAVGLDDKEPEWVAIPAMIERLNDADRVVRMTANDGLKERTRRDFGFVAWAPPEERAKAVDRWRAWWKERQAQAAYPKDEDLTKVSTRTARGRRIGWRGDQGGN